MKNPYHRVPQEKRLKYFLVVLGLTLLLALIMGSLLAPLMEKNGGDRVIIPLELAKDVKEASSILKFWNEEDKQIVRVNIYLDFILIIGYSLLLSAACFEAFERIRDRTSKQSLIFPIHALMWAGFLLGWGAILAGLFDMVENVAMLRMLAVGAADPFPQISSLFAGMKFKLLGAALGYSVITSIGILFWNKE